MKWQIRLRKRLLLNRDSKWNLYVREFTAWLEKPYWPWPRESKYPYREGDFIIIGPNCFSSADRAVICWMGENYVRQVLTRPPRGSSPIEK
jgi:hypothetical protein